MKRLRPWLLPLASFALAWIVASWIGGRFEGAPETAAALEPPPRYRARPVENPVRVDIDAWVRDFRAAPAEARAERWAVFAAEASVDELERLIEPGGGRTSVGARRDGRNLPRLLAQEELAARTRDALPPLPGAYAARAEVDPEGAWREVEAAGRSDLAIAVLRTLAAGDPLEALERCRALPELKPRPWDYMGDAGAGGMNAHSPLGAVMAAWVRQDPAAALAAFDTLAPDERLKVGPDVAAALAFRDGAAAIPFVLKSAGGAYHPAHGEGEGWNRALRAAFFKDPEGSARAMVEHPVLRERMDGGRMRRFVLKPWFDADPQGVAEWMLEDEAKREDRAGSVFGLVWTDPGQTEDCLRRLADAGESGLVVKLLERLAYRDHDRAIGLAGDFGVSAAELPPISKWLPNQDPASAIGLWLDRIAGGAEPEVLLEELDWDRRTLGRLLSIARRSFPDRAGALADSMPAGAASAVGAAGSSGPTMQPEPRSWLELDPGAVAAANEAPDARLAGTIMASWAPYDPAAAERWMEELSDPEARSEAERKWLDVRAVADPQGVLEHALETGRGLGMADQCLHRILWRGGDWRASYERLPPSHRQPYVRYRLEADERLLKLLRSRAR